MFGNNIITHRVNSTSLGLGTTYLLRNTGITQSSNDIYGGGLPLAQSVVPIAKRDDHHVYAIFDRQLYRLNAGTGRRTSIGSALQASNISCLIWAPIANELYAIGGNRIYTLDPDDGTITSTNTLRSSIAAVAGFENGQGRLTVWDNAGAISNIFTANGLVNAGGVGNLGANRGGFFAEGHYWVIDSTGNVKRRGPNTSDTVDTVLDPEPIANSNRTAAGMFEINGTIHFFGYRSASRNVRTYKLDGLFPRLYRRGSVVNILTLPNPQNIELGSGYISRTITLPAASGGKSPYTYHLLGSSGGTILPRGFTFNAQTRQLTIAAGLNRFDYRFQYKVTDSETPTQAVTQVFSININAPVTQPTGELSIPARQVISTDAGDSSAIRISSARGGTLPYSYELGRQTGTPAVPATAWNATRSFLGSLALSSDASEQDIFNPNDVWSLNQTTKRLTRFRIRGNAATTQDFGLLPSNVRSFITGRSPFSRLVQLSATTFQVAVYATVDNERRFVITINPTTNTVTSATTPTLVGTFDAPYFTRTIAIGQTCTM